MTTTRTVDYEYEDLGLEVTSIHEYLPRNNEMDQLLSRNVETNSRICAYMDLKDDRLKIKILDELQLDKNVSILCLRQHISCYRPKLISKIIDKYCQDEKHNSHIIIMDFRLVILMIRKLLNRSEIITNSDAYIVSTNGLKAGVQVWQKIVKHRLGNAKPE